MNQTKPTFVVTEVFTEGKTGPERPDINDDRVVSIRDYTAVFDGVTGPQGAAAAECAVRVLKTMPADASERTFARLVGMAMREEFGEILPTTRMPACTGVILNHARSELWFYGDAAAVLITADSHNVLIRDAEFVWTDALHKTRVLYNSLLLRSGEMKSEDELYDRDPGHEMLMDVGKRQHLMANVKGGYTVLCAKDVPDDMACVVPVEAELEAIILLSDGYPLEPRVRADFLSLEAIETALAVTNTADPHCLGINLGPKGILRNPETGKLNVSYDDRSYIKILVM